MGDRFATGMSDPQLSRRRFLGASLIGTAVVYGGSGLSLLTTAPTARAQSPEHQFLRAVDVTYFSAMLPAVIVQARAEDLPVFLRSFESMLGPASPHTLGAIQALVDLLTGSLTRPLMTLRWSDWSELSTNEVASVLEDWRTSSLGLKRVAYALTSSLIRTAWYMQPDQQAISGYPGPPRKIVEPRLSIGEGGES